MAVTLMLALIVAIVALFALARRGGEDDGMSAVASPSRLSPFARPPQLADWLILTAIVVVSVAAAFPLAWMVLTSLKTPAETMQTPPVWIPATPSLDGLRQGLRALSRPDGRSSIPRSSPR